MRSGCSGWPRFLTVLCAIVVTFMVVGCDGVFNNEVTTRFGPIRGLWKRSTRGRLVANFLGVPYALPPVGDLRFRSPLPWNRTWTETFEAIVHGPVCLQWDNNYNNKVSGSEDCLYLNIYVPVISEKEDLNITLPVMFYIHGGMYFKGSGDSHKLPPDYLMDQNVILITVNYRLNILGFLSTGTEASPGNYGLKDLIEALRWVRENIHSFHGDPDNVTVWGHSAGALLSHLLAMSNRAEGLFNRYIILGGTALTPWATSTNRRARTIAIRSAKKLNCLPLKTKPADTKIDDNEENESEKEAEDKEKEDSSEKEIDGTDKNKTEETSNENEIQKDVKNETQTNDQSEEEIEEDLEDMSYLGVDYEVRYTAEEEEDLMWCMRHVDALELISVAKEFHLKGDTCCVFAPVIEPESNDAAVTMHPVEAVKERRFRDLPFIIGVTEHEGVAKTADILAGNDTLLNWLLSDFESNIPYMLNYYQMVFNTTVFAKALEDFYFSGNMSYSNLKENITMLQTDSGFIWPTYMTAKLLSEVMNSSIYVYLFSYDGTFTATFKTGSSIHYGVSHMDDLNYLIPLTNKRYESYMLHNTENDITMINIMTEMWSSFATTGVPEAWTIPAWPDWHESNEFLKFGNGKQPEVTVEKDFFPERIAFWEELSKIIEFEIMELDFLRQPITEAPAKPNASDNRTINKVLLCILTMLIIKFL